MNLQTLGLKYLLRASWVRLAGDKLFFVTYRQRRGSMGRVVLPQSI